jgi:hypothetical protein
MKRIFTLLLSISCLIGQAQTLAAWDFETSTAVPSTNPTNGTASSVTVSSGLAATSYVTGVGGAPGKAITTSGFLSSATDFTKYYQFSITPNGGFNMNLSAVTFQTQRSNTGPATWVLRSSLDGYASNIATGSVPTAFAQQTSGVLTSNPAYQGISSETIFRIYGLSATSTGGTMRIDNLIIEGSTAPASTAPLVIVSKSSIAVGNTTVGTPSATQTYNVSGINLTSDITVTAPAEYEISTFGTSGFGPSLNLTQASGSVPVTPIYVRLIGTTLGSFSGDITNTSTGATTKNVALTGSVNPISTSPIINVSVATLSPMTATVGSNSSSQNYTVSGSNLTDNITITAPSGFAVSLSNNVGFGPSITLTQTGGIVNGRTIYVRLTGVTQGSYAGNVTHTSTGATTQNVAVTGNVNPVFTGQNYVHLRGNFHAHTVYSDGETLPTDAYNYAKLSNQMDFLGIAEHNHLTTKNQHILGFQQAAASSSSTFSALYGMEYGVISTGGHMLIYGLNELIGWDAGNNDIFSAKNDFPSLYAIINAHPGAWSSMAHPQSGDYADIIGSMAYSTEADNSIEACAVRNGPSTSVNTSYEDPSSSNFESVYKNMLDKGYHVGPFIDHDNHNITFGRTTPARTVVLAESNTSANILAGVKARRIYASDDWNEKVDFTLSGMNLGSIGNVSGNPSISITVSDPDGEVPSKIEIFYGVPGSNINATVLTSSSNSNTLSYTHAIALNSSYYYYVKVSQTDGNLLWTAPIWATKTSNILPIELVDFKAQLLEETKTVAVTWHVEQTGAATYIVERSVDGKTFDALGKVKGETKGGSYDYSYNDVKPVEGYAYYRLRQIDEDGTFKFSNIVSVYFKPKYLKFKSLSPNPSSDVVNVLFDAEKEVHDYAYFIYDEGGRAILYKKLDITEGENNVSIDISKLPVGLYYLNVGRRDDRIIQTKFVKK